MNSEPSPHWADGVAHRPTESKSRLAAVKLRNAGLERRNARSGGPSAEADLTEAVRFEAEAAALMRPPVAPTIRSGEVIYVPDDSGPASEIADTLRDPDQAAIEASVKRTELLLTPVADLVALAVDAAASAKAANSFEKMLAHQLTVIHILAMKTATRALEFEKRQGVCGQGFMQADSIELGRLANAVSRLSSSFQEGLLTFQRIKTGASQTVTVRHVTVGPGGQAVFGNVKTGAKGGSKAPRGMRPK
jgi:hypothetical protein